MPIEPTAPETNTSLGPLLRAGPIDAPWVLCLAHGAGAPMDSPFMEAIAARLSARALHVVRFEFPYMQRRRSEGTRRPPDRQPKLLDAWRDIHATLKATLAPHQRLAIGGKSMGGRMASLIADEVGADALICLGYPFHPPGKPDRLRTDHLLALQTPTLIVQGERDPFGRREEVDCYPLSQAIQVLWTEDGDHDLKPRKRSGITKDGVLEAATQNIVDFLHAGVE